MTMGEEQKKKKDMLADASASKDSGFIPDGSIRVIPVSAPAKTFFGRAAEEPKPRKRTEDGPLVLELPKPRKPLKIE